MFYLTVNKPISHDSVSHVICAFFLDDDNLQGWFFAEDDGNQIKKQKHPLLLRQMPVVMSKLQEFKVRLLYFPKVCQFLPSCQGWLAQLQCGANKATVRGSTTVQAVGFITVKAGIVESLSDHSNLFRFVR